MGFLSSSLLSSKHLESILILHHEAMKFASTWYTNLEASRIRTWKDLTTTFLWQYQYNSDMAPDRTQLQNMIQRESESFKEYA